MRGWLARSGGCARAAVRTLGGLFVRRAAGVALAMLTLQAGTAGAQSIAPMRGNVASFADQFAIRVKSSNPYKHRIGVEMKVYDHKFRPVTNVRLVPERFQLGGGASRNVTAYIPFEGQSPRYVRVCAESVPYRQTATHIRTRVCGKFRALRR